MELLKSLLVPFFGIIFLVKGKSMTVHSEVNHILLKTDISRDPEEDAAKAISHFEMNDKLTYVMTTFNQSFKV